MGGLTKLLRYRVAGCKSIKKSHMVFTYGSFRFLSMMSLCVNISFAFTTRNEVIKEYGVQLKQCVSKSIILNCIIR
jgi:hypothetical protein